jgi:D-3-phosphoglycerate dehydrogenase / 2-oxoglutarate reductase
VMVVDQLRDYLEHGNVVNAVNFPQVSMARESAFRVAIANANVPNMLGQISTAMAHAGLNIHNMVNKSRGEMAYTLVDVDSAVAAPVLDSLRAIGGVLSVRYLPHLRGQQPVPGLPPGRRRSLDAFAPCQGHGLADGPVGAR